MNGRFCFVSSLSIVTTMWSKLYLQITASCPFIIAKTAFTIYTHERRKSLAICTFRACRTCVFWVGPCARTILLHVTCPTVYRWAHTLPFRYRNNFPYNRQESFSSRSFVQSNVTKVMVKLVDVFYAEHQERKNENRRYMSTWLTLCNTQGSSVAWITRFFLVYSACWSTCSRTHNDYYNLFVGEKNQQLIRLKALTNNKLRHLCVCKTFAYSHFWCKATHASFFWALQSGWSYGHFLGLPQTLSYIFAPLQELKLCLARQSSSALWAKVHRSSST